MTNDEFADNEETAARAIDVIAILTEGFDALADGGSVSVDHDKGLVFLTAYDWWANPVRLPIDAYGKGSGYARLVEDHRRPVATTGEQFAVYE